MLKGKNAVNVFANPPRNRLMLQKNPEKINVESEFNKQLNTIDFLV
jgi:hypothetical protein